MTRLVMIAAAACLLLLAVAGLTATGPFAPHPAAAQTAGEADRLEDEVETAVQTRQQTQAELDEWAVEKAELVRRFETATETVAWLQERKAVEQARVAAVEQRVAELRRRLDEARRLEASLEDTLSVTLGRLDAAVERSLPFLPQERSTRLERLHEELVQPDVPAAEKLRRVLEALQVETGYGGSVEVYQDRIELTDPAGRAGRAGQADQAGQADRADRADRALHVDILRLGRLALFWRTPDGRRVGHYDPAAAGWAELDASYRRPIGLAMEMATRRRPVELIALPLGRIEP